MLNTNSYFFLFSFVAAAVGVGLRVLPARGLFSAFELAGIAGAAACLLSVVSVFSVVGG